MPDFAPSALIAAFFYLLSGLLVIGLVANLLVRPVPRKWFMSDAEVAELQVRGGSAAMAVSSDTGGASLAAADLLAIAAGAPGVVASRAAGG